MWALRRQSDFPVTALCFQQASFIFSLVAGGSERCEECWVQQAAVVLLPAMVWCGSALSVCMEGFFW